MQHFTTLCDTLQHSATPCNTLQHSATLYNTLQYPATTVHIAIRTSNVCIHTHTFMRTRVLIYKHLNTLQHTRFTCIYMHTATLCNTLHHSASHCNTLQHSATLCNTLQYSAILCNTLQHTATHLLDMYLHTPACRQHYTCLYV